MTSARRIEVAQIVTRFIAGAGGVALRGAASLDPERYHVTIVTGEGDGLLTQAREAGMEVIVEPSLVPTISLRHDQMSLRRLRELCRQRRFDVVHTHSAKAGVLGRIAAHRAGVPRIVHTYHGFPFHEFQSPLRRAAYVAIERRVARLTDVVLAVGGGVATEALRRGLANPTTIRTITPVVGTTVVPKTTETMLAARARIGLPSSARVVGTVGRIDFQKAPEHLVTAVSALRNSDVVAVWVGSGPQRDEVASWVRDRDLTDRVVLLGHRDDVADLLPAFDVFVMSSRYEGLPCAVVEAMRCGLPVVATAVNSVPELVIPGETGLLVPPARPDLLADAIDAVFDDPDLADRLMRNGRALAGAPFDAARLGRVLDEVYSGAPVPADVAKAS
jgi:glycosyltransferase involved in cell wall biosynthesis